MLIISFKRKIITKIVNLFITITRNIIILNILSNNYLILMTNISEIGENLLCIELNTLKRHTILYINQRKKLFSSI